MFALCAIIQICVMPILISSVAKDYSESIFQSPSEIQSRDSLWGSSYESFVKHVLVINRSRIYDILWKLRKNVKPNIYFRWNGFIRV